MDASVGHEIFSQAALWGGCLGLVGTGFVLLGVLFAHVSGRLRAAVRRYGLSSFSDSNTPAPDIPSLLLPIPRGQTVEVLTTGTAVIFR